MYFLQQKDEYNYFFSGSKWNKIKKINQLIN